MKGAIFVKDWIASRASVGVHPVYNHPMNIEARKVWIENKRITLNEQVDGDSDSEREECDDEEEEEDDETSDSDNDSSDSDEGDY